MNKKALAAALLSFIMPTVFALCYFVLFPDPPLSRIFYGASRAFFILFPVLWILLVEKKKFSFPRFSQRGMRQGIIAGLTIGITAMVLYINVFVNILDLTEVNNKASQLGFGGSHFLFFAIFIVIANSSLEEYFWRWFNFTKLKEICKPSAALVLTGLGFALHHVVILLVFFNWWQGLFFGFSVGVGGIIMAWFYHKYDNIWSPWICHAIIDAALMFIGFDMLFCR